jgi:hypothetical protein
MEDIMQCPFCKEEIKDGAIKCKHCDSMLSEPIKTAASPPNPPPHGPDVEITDEDYNAFIGKNSHQYLPRFRKFSLSGIDNFVATWHWPAFIFGFFWMFYRKLYLWAFAALATNLLFGIILQIVFGDQIGIISGIATQIILGSIWGIIGYYLYYKHAKKKISVFKLAQPAEKVSKVLPLIGGVHKWLLTAYVIITLVCIVVGLVLALGLPIYEGYKKRANEIAQKTLQQITANQEKQQPSTTVDDNVFNSRYGKIEIKEINQGEKAVLLSSKVIFKRESGFLSIEKTFQIHDNDVVLIRNSEGGSGTIDSFFFITLAQGSSPIVSEGFMAQKSDKINPVQKETHIVVDLGYKDGAHEILTYQDGKLFIQKSVSEGKKDQANEDDCNYLYTNIYVAYVQQRECKEDPEYVGGMSTVRFYNMLSNDPRLNLNEFQKLSRATCQKGDLIKYSEFKKIVCDH